MTSFQIIHIEETDSTNRWVKSLPLQGRGTVGWAEYQTKGRGQGTNTWESERGMNLTFSVRFCPEGVKANAQFIISMAISIALTKTLQVMHPVTIKWPNDIYVGDKKICGILIENVLAGGGIKDCVIGIGLNVNQTLFVSDAPNPTSMKLESGKEHDRREVLETLLENFEEVLTNWDEGSIRTEYRRQLYRKEGLFTYRDEKGQFSASVVDVEDDGHLLLKDSEGVLRRYAFKEVTFVI